MAQLLSNLIASSRLVCTSEMQSVTTNPQIVHAFAHQPAHRSDIDLVYISDDPDDLAHEEASCRFD